MGARAVKIISRVKPQNLLLTRLAESGYNRSQESYHWSSQDVEQTRQYPLTIMSCRHGSVTFFSITIKLQLLRILLITITITIQSYQLQLQLQLHVKVLQIITQTPLLALLPASTCTFIL